MTTEIHHVTFYKCTPCGKLSQPAVFYAERSLVSTINTCKIWHETGTVGIKPLSWSAQLEQMGQTAAKDTYFNTDIREGSAAQENLPCTRPAAPCPELLLQAVLRRPPALPIRLRCCCLCSFSEQEPLGLFLRSSQWLEDTTHLNLSRI